MSLSQKDSFINVRSIFWKPCNNHFKRGLGSNPAILNHKFTLKVNVPTLGEMQQLTIPFYCMYPSRKLSVDST